MKKTFPKSHEATLFPINKVLYQQCRIIERFIDCTEKCTLSLILRNCHLLLQLFPFVSSLFPLVSFSSFFKL